MEEVELGDHQLKAVAALSNGRILTGGVGVGKSRVAVRYYVEKESPRDVFVITTAKKRDSFDWEEESVRQGVGTTREGTFHGVLTVDSWNNLWKYAHVENAFFIFDEQRLVGSGAWVHAFYKIAKKNRWILLSATPGDTWLDYIPVFVANGLYKNRTEFLREHVVYSRFSKFPKVERYIGVGRLVRHKHNLLVEMPYQRHTRRIIKHVPVDFDEPTFKRVVKDRWHVYENRPLRDVAELFSVMRKVVNSDASRLRCLENLLLDHPKVIVFYNFDYELEILRTLSTTSTRSNSSSPILVHKTRKGGLEETTTVDRDTSISGRKSSSGNEQNNSSSSTTSKTFVIAEWNGHKHEPIPKADRWVYLVQYQAGAEGWNCTETDVCVFYSLNYSYRIFEQCQGRIDRMNTPFTDLYYYVLKSKSAIDTVIWRALTVKKKFNEPRTEQAVDRVLWDAEKAS